MTDQPPMKAYMVAGIFGLPPEQHLRQAVFLAMNDAMAIAMFVSASHAQNGEQQLCVSISCEEIRADVIAAAHRGTAGPAPVVSLVPQAPTLDVRYYNDDGSRKRHVCDFMHCCGLPKDDPIHIQPDEISPDGAA